MRKVVLISAPSSLSQSMAKEVKECIDKLNGDFECEIAKPKGNDYEPLSQFDAMAPAIHINKQIEQLAPHKSFNKRSKFKRRSKSK